MIKTKYADELKALDIFSLIKPEEGDVLLPTNFTRVEVIGKEGREYVLNRCESVLLSVQDEGRTLKIFIKRKEKLNE